MTRIFMIGYSENKGGVESYVTNLCSQFPSDKYEIIHRLPKIHIDGKEWVCPPNRHNFIKYWLFWKKFFRENKFDVIYSNVCTIASIDELRFAKKAKIPIRIIHAHSTGYKKSNAFHKICERINRRILPRYATHFLACSKKAGEWMFGKQPFDIIQNGIDLKDYKYREEIRNRIRIENQIKKESLTAGIIGRLSEQKNPFFAIDVVDAFLDEDSSRRAVIIGDGELRQQVQEYVSSRKNGNRIIIVGAVNNVGEWLSAIDVLIMPSLWEGFPFVLVEAQATGLPCVVSNAIPPEADLTGLISYFDIKKTSEDWAQLVASMCKKERKDTSGQIVAAGYSINETAKKVIHIIDGQ